jgi:hypothetical protein
VNDLGLDIMSFESIPMLKKVIKSTNVDYKNYKR